MERGGLQWRARSSFEKAHGEAPPRLQVIGFNVCAPKLGEAAREGLEKVKASSDHNEAPASHDLLSFENNPKPSASSPRSALQQLLLNQSPPSTSSPSSNLSFPHGLLLVPPFTSSELLTPTSSSPSPNHNLTCGLLLQPAISPPAANQNWTINASKLGRTPSSGRLKSLLQAENGSSDIPANQHSHISLFSSMCQSPCASSSSSGNQSMKGGSVSVNVQMINQHNPKPSQAPIKETYEAFFRIKQKTDDEACYIEEKKILNNGDDAKTREISAKEVINELPYAAKSKRSSWLHDDEADKCKKSSFKGVHEQSIEHPFGEKSRKSSRNEEKSKKSTLFMFVVSSPAPEFHHHHHHGENNMSKDMDFLSSCHLCRCFLRQGEDVFMYNGDKAFCSMECRYQQIVIDERKEKCPPPIIRSGASQVYQHTSTAATTTTHHPIMINKPHFIKTAAAA